MTRNDFTELTTLATVLNQLLHATGADVFISIDACLRDDHISGDIEITEPNRARRYSLENEALLLNETWIRS